ncbi:MAG: hypothetical protein Q9M36_07105 [Sulfurovum sp.]|nr:hypothetical protein [Sulfurovum sp.]
MDEFIDNAIEFENDLGSQDETKHSEAIETLSDLSNVLYLSKIQEILQNISDSTVENRASIIATFYQTLSRITVSEATEKPVVQSIPEPIAEIIPQVIPEPVAEISPEPISKLSISEQIASTQTIPSSKSFGSLSLEGIRPKHFDFQLEEAANDLSLPVELIEEFVHDFIDQAHIETKKMLVSYEKGDLDAIQKIGHLLKGASSNLRINTLSDTLYKIQFCEESAHLEILIKDYWAHFLSFEHQINVISQ